MSQVWNIDTINRTSSSPSSDIEKIVEGFNALRSVFSGSAPPQNTIAYMWWADTHQQVLKQRDATNSNWVIRSSLVTQSILKKVTADTITAKEYGHTFLCDASDTSFTLTLSKASELSDGFWITLKKVDTSLNSIYIKTAAGELIEGLAQWILSNPTETCTVVCDGQQFFIVNHIRPPLEKSPLILPENLPTQPSQVVTFDETGQGRYQPKGKILQVLQCIKTDTAFTNSTEWSEVPGLRQAITLHHPNNQVLVMATLQVSCRATETQGRIKLHRDAQELCLGNPADTRTRLSAGPVGSSHPEQVQTIHITYLDSPNWVYAMNYCLVFSVIVGGRPFFVNQAWGDKDTSLCGRQASTLTLLEVER